MANRVKIVESNLNCHSERSATREAKNLKNRDISTFSKSQYDKWRRASAIRRI
ncbi:hypothetical protein [Helicobacter sp. 23-1045]